MQGRHLFGLVRAGGRQVGGGGAVGRITPTTRQERGRRGPAGDSPHPIAATPREGSRTPEQAASATSSSGDLSCKRMQGETACTSNFGILSALVGPKVGPLQGSH